MQIANLVLDRYSSSKDKKNTILKTIWKCQRFEKNSCTGCFMVNFENTRKYYSFKISLALEREEKNLHTTGYCLTGLNFVDPMRSGTVLVVLIVIPLWTQFVISKISWKITKQGGNKFQSSQLESRPLESTILNAEVTISKLYLIKLEIHNIHNFNKPWSGREVMGGSSRSRRSHQKVNALGLGGNHWYLLGKWRIGFIACFVVLQ